ncbi:islet cell autoantigen 1-like protein [Prorops nasuta]|uniref:islet cell autoantigen 1-like protein n=1 Tax=Prorops nasuta TaxID=863751 RepID=UPI0034CE2069
MNTFDRNEHGGPFDRWVQKSNISDDSTITKMQHHFWITKQTLSRKLGKKEDECIVSSDAELDAKLELFRSIQESCLYLQRIIDKYQERLCNLAQEENAMGRFLKEAGKQDKTRAGKMMSAVGKSVSYSGQQRIALRTPLVRLYQEVETFRQRAIEDTLQNIEAMEKARTEYRAALSWMKNISQELDPDTSKQLEKFRKVQTRVRRGKTTFDNLALDCLQKVDLLAAARCNMFSHALVLYQSTLLDFTRKSAKAYSIIANSFKGHQQYDFMIMPELTETSSKLAQETGGNNDDIDDKDRFSFLEEDYHDNVEPAEEATSIDKSTPKEKQNEKLLDIENDVNEANSVQVEKEIVALNSSMHNIKILEKSFNDLASRELEPNDILQQIDKKESIVQFDLEKDLAMLDLEMDSFTESDSAFNFADINTLMPCINQPSNSSLQMQTSENVALLDEILDKNQLSTEWDMTSLDTFLPPNILKQSLGDATLGIKQQNIQANCSNNNKNINKGIKQKGSSWLDLFAELDPLANNPIESFCNDNNAPV